MGARKKSNVSLTDVRRIAAEASCDPRTVQKYVDGEDIRHLVVERIKKAMIALKIKM